MAKLTKTETHEKAVEYAACNLIENGIVTRAGSKPGIDLILDNGKTILVRGKSGEGDIPLMNGSLDTLKADYLIIVTNLGYSCTRHIYIMTMSDAKRLAINQPYKVDGRANYFVKPSEYRYYNEDYTVV